MPTEHHDPGEPDRVALHARNVSFDWSELPRHWIPGEPFATHLINVLHLLLPEGERWFCHVFKQALPLIRDEQLAEDVRGFIGQEAVHAESHQGVLDHFDAHGTDTRPYVQQISWLFGKVLGDRGYAGKQGQEWIVERVALIAAIEHFTAFLGQWVLDARELDEAGADPTMLDLLRWHGAEEVEHRSVAHDLFAHLDGRYSRRVRTMLIAAPLFRGRLPIVRDRVTCISTPGQDVDVLVTQAGVAVNPKNTELRERLRAAGLPVVDIHELKERAERITGVPAPLPVSDRVVARVISRDGELLDTIRQTDNRSGI